MQKPDIYHQSEALAKAREDIAMHKAEIAMHKAEIADIRRDISDMRMCFEKAQETTNEALQSIQFTLAEARGGWRTFVWIGTGCASLGAGLAWVFEQLIKRPP